VVGPLVFVVSLSRWTGLDAARGSRRSSPARLGALVAGAQRPARRSGRVLLGVNVAPIEQTGPGKDGRRGAEFAATVQRATAPHAAVRPSVHPCRARLHKAPSYIKHVPETKVRVCRVRACVAEHSAGKETHLSPTRVEPPSRPTQHKTL
jgi:hypothetical protein